MLEFENTIRIARPVGEVFAFVLDFENIPKWNYYVLEVRRLSEGPTGIGTTYHQVRKTDQQDFRIIEFEPDHTVAVKTLPQSSPSFERRFTLYEEGDTTRIRDQWKLDTGRPALLERLARGRVKSAVAENLSKLKELLEEGRVVLQDGRQVTL
ncbi:MAG TPA: SRPBCC family protein [Rubrobacter sp.]|nr:SRPBCC family protein [Rubrobacter sp.]